MPRRAYFGDLLLPDYLLGIVPEQQRQMQVHPGVDRDYALHVPSSPNVSTRLMVQTLWTDSNYTKRGFRSMEMVVRAALIARAGATHPVVWVESETPSTTVASSSGAVITTTANPNGFTTGDVVLIRRSGVGLYTLGSVTARTSNSITVAASHTYHAGDTIQLVEAYWSAFIWDSLQAIPLSGQSDSYTDAASFLFVGAGGTTYHRTTATFP